MPMLALSRRADEAILIGDDIVLTVLGIRGDQVRIGITAPPDVEILRDELVDEIDDAGHEPAAKTVPTT